MAFWGIEVKPGKPFTHKFDDSKGRLHVSTASLGLGSAIKKSVLQCNVGNKSPVFLCSLYPEKSESLQLNLEFEEVDEVIFSVIGPRSIHLSGYYLGGGRYRSLNEESESYGEDIADTDTQRSDYSDEDEYEDSFINDDDPEVLSPSPLSSSGEENMDGKKHQNGKGNCRRRLRKTHQLSESDDEDCSRQENNTNGDPATPILASEDDDNCPISLCLKAGMSAKKSIQNGGENADKGIVENSNKKPEDDGNYVTKSKCNADDTVVSGQPIRQSDLPADPVSPSEAGDKNVGTQRKKRKERTESERVKVGKTQMSEAKFDTDNNSKDGQMPNLTDDVELAAQENDERPKKKKKRKEPKNEEKKAFDVETPEPVNEGKEKDRQDMAKEENESEEKKVKKKKKKKSEKSQENGVAVNSEMPRLLVEVKNTSSMDAESKTTIAKTSQVQTLQNGLVIEVLQLGKPDGKVAVPGNKVSLRYVGKLKKTGEVIDSNVDQDLFRFRLGAGKVIEGWEAGLQGMQVGEKRRLTVPPTMGYGSEGDGNNIPPDSWLVYEVELIKVR